MIKDEAFMSERIPKIYFYMNLISAVNGGRKRKQETIFNNLAWYTEMNNKLDQELCDFFIDHFPMKGHVLPNDICLRDSVSLSKLQFLHQ